MAGQGCRGKGLERKLIHLLLGLGIILVFWTLPIPPVLLLVAGILAQGIFLLNRRIALPIIGWLVERWEKEEHKKVMPGHGLFMFVLGSGLSLMLFPREIALAGIAVLTVGDPLAAIVGGKWGKAEKSTIGTLAGFLGGFAVSIVFVSPIQGLASALLGMLAECLRIRLFSFEMSDNMLVPIAASLGGFLAG